MRDIRIHGFCKKSKGKIVLFSQDTLTECQSSFKRNIVTLFY